MNKAPTGKKQELLSFSEALYKMLEGDRVTRMEWEDEGEYGVILSDGFLAIRHDNQMHIWKVHKDDILADDWYVI
jgi:hypothetical protein